MAGAYEVLVFLASAAQVHARRRCMAHRLRIRTKAMAMLANKTALVTGASRGIGRATALALGAAGARVIVHYGHNADEAKAVVDQIRANGGQAEPIGADLAAPDAAHALAANVRHPVCGK